MRFEQNMKTAIRSVVNVIFSEHDSIRQATPAIIDDILSCAVQDICMTLVKDTQIMKGELYLTKN